MPGPHPTHTFWTPSLHATYARCAWPAGTVSGNATTLSSAPYAHGTTPRSSWRPRHARPPGPTVNGAPSRPLGPEFTAREAGVPEAPPVHKKARLSHAQRERAAAATEAAPRATVLRMYKMRLRCTAAQRRELTDHWFGAARAAYNLMVDGLNHDHCKAKPEAVNDLCSESGRRADWVRNNAHPPPPATWNQYRCLYKNAMLEAVAAQKGNLTKLRKNPAHTWTLKFRSWRRDPTECIRLDAAQYKRDPTTGLPDRSSRPHPTGPVLRIERVPGPADDPRPKARVYLGKGMIPLGPVTVRDRRWLIDRLTAAGYCEHESKLLWDKRRRALYWLVGLDREPPDPATRPDPRDLRVVALDPGVRRFQTWYDPATGGYGELLAGYGAPGTREIPVAEEIEARCGRIDRGQSRWQRRRRHPEWFLARPFGRTHRRWRQHHPRPDRAHRRWMHRRAHRGQRQARRQWQRDLARLDGFKQSMHYAAVGYLWQHWDVVIATTFSSGEINRRRNGARPFNSRTARRGMNWGHYAFRQRLKSRAELLGREVIETSEEFTSRTCGRCGTDHPNLGSAAVFDCPSVTCDVVVDRDVHAARNIALLVLTDRLAPQWRGV